MDDDASDPCRGWCESGLRRAEIPLLYSLSLLLLARVARLFVRGSLGS